MASKSQKHMVSAVFQNREDAERAFDMLHASGYADREINVLMSDKTRAAYYTDRDETIAAGNYATEGMGIGGAVGTAVGAALGAVAAVGTTLAIPGLGLVLAGPLVAALAGGGAGAVSGGLVGALVGWGIPESNAQAYEHALRNGGIVIGVEPRNSDDRARIKEEFEQLNGDNVIECSC